MWDERIRRRRKKAEEDEEIDTQLIDDREQCLITLIMIS